ncbi:MAG: prohibitin family protein [Alphaproteobacteria bacterium]|nr:prohibitin family protein [Alphaproteobacteria bacterium]
MSFLFAVLGLFALVVAAVSAARGRALPSSLAATVGVLLILSTAFVIVSPGRTGVRVLLGRVHDVELTEGLHLKSPLTSVIQMSIRTETYSMTTSGEDSIQALSADGLKMPLDVTIAYRLVGDDAAWIYRNIGPTYEEKVIRTAARASVREAAAHYLAQEAYATKREELARAMEETLRARVSGLLKEAGLDKGGFLIQQVLLRNVELPDRVAEAIQEKLAADQDAQRMDFVLTKETKEAERKRIEAQGIKAFQDIVSQGIDDKLLRWKGIEATSHLAESANAKVVIIGGADGLPVILNTDGR